MLCCVQGGPTALYWAADRGYAHIVQILVDHGAAVDLGRNMVTNMYYLMGGILGVISLLSMLVLI